VNKVTGVVTVTGVGAGTATITCKDAETGVTGTIDITVAATSAIIPSTVTGTWSGEDGLMGYGATVVVNADGTGTFTCVDAGIEVTFTLKSKSGNVYTFECSNGKELKLEIGASHLFVTYDGGDMDPDSYATFDDATFDR